LITEYDKKLLNEYLEYVRNGSRTLEDIDNVVYQIELVKMIQDDIINNRSTWYERKAIKSYIADNAN